MIDSKTAKVSKSIPTYGHFIKNIRIGDTFEIKASEVPNLDRMVGVGIYLILEVTGQITKKDGDTITISIKEVNKVN